MPGKAERLDLVMVERGIAASRSRAQAMIMAGVVTIDGQPATRAGQGVGGDQVIAIDEGPKFVSRGGEKLQHALETFAIDVTGRTCADIGASTGGFTDCLLQAGASRVYAVDVGYGQIDARLRNDARVVTMERVNARYLTELPEPVSIVSIDVSFISLNLIFPVAVRVMDVTGEVIALVKPQFEAGRSQVGKKGVVSDLRVHQEVLERVIGYAQHHELAVSGLTTSPLRGPAGNREFLMYLRKGANADTRDWAPIIDALVQEG